ncbi:MAG: hypothetical protein M1823_000769 [Watsoniomyces obsoletus]|nr:MAG: hypothetical protein M1823_000769 [Watsoniomyces obsoletus]
MSSLRLASASPVNHDDVDADWRDSQTPSEHTTGPTTDRPASRPPRRPRSSTAAVNINSLIQKTPARSYFHHSYHGQHGELSTLAPCIHEDVTNDQFTSGDAHQYPSRLVREETAELASYALSDAASDVYGGTPPEDEPLDASDAAARVDAKSGPDEEGRGRRASDRLPVAEAIEEVSEPVSPVSAPTPQHPSPGTSVLTELLRNSPPDEEEPRLVSQSRAQSKQSRPRGQASAVEAESSMWADGPADERTALLATEADRKWRANGESRASDLERQRERPRTAWRRLARPQEWLDKNRWASARVLVSPKDWDARAIWQQGVVHPASYVPAVILGLLLNLLDALSYGMILFPLGQPVFAHLGPDGISMFYVSCIISQLVFSCGGSVFKGGVGSEMIEVVPFFHKMAFTILTRVGEDNPRSVLATTVLSYSISSVLTGLVFLGMGACRLGSLIGFFPRHILIGCIGGIGWFLVATGIEVSARLESNLDYDLATLKRLFQFDTVFLWTIPLFLAIFLIGCQHWIKHPLFVPCYFLLIPAIFYFFVAAIPALNLEQLRRLGWIFTMPPAGVPFYHFYSLYDFGAVNWTALIKTVPAMFALTFFGILHVPINVPALGFSTGEDNVDVDRELVAHGISNALSGFAGSIQNYLVYTNSCLFIRSGGNSRVAGVMLAIGTAGIMMAGPTIVGYIPIMVIGALIFLLGIELIREALYDTWGRVNRLEYLTIVTIVVTMGAWDFVVGIFAGIVLACVNFVVQTSRKSAIRASYTGEIAGSTVRRHPAQRRFLRRVGKQIHVAKLAGYLFFGTIVSVENRIRAMLDDEAFKARPIRFLIFDMAHVTGIDFSAAEAFTRINRVLGGKNVNLIVCGVARDGEIERSLRSVGLWDDESNVQTFEDLNSALEYCENELLKTFYSRRDALTHRSAPSHNLDVPKTGSASLSIDAAFSSPRRTHLHQIAHQTLHEHHDAMMPPSKWQHFRQPLPLLLQAFHDLTDKNEDFWFRASSFFERKEYPSGTIVFQRGDPPEGFYLLEEGVFRAEYRQPQGTFYESIVAGTTCGELPFFSGTNRTATLIAERDSVAWLLSQEKWEEMQIKCPDVAKELLRISLKLTSERMAAITSYVLTTAG